MSILSCKSEQTLLEKYIEYDYEEYQIWINENDTIRIKIIDAILKQCGYKKSDNIIFNMSRSAFYNQSKRGNGPNTGAQHYPEVSYARILMERDGFQKEFIIYENYYLSQERIDNIKSPTGNKAQGTYMLQNVFSENFFREFDRLYECNKEKIRNNNGKIISAEKLHVDLCAIRHTPRKRQIRFCEIKREDSNDDFQPHQCYLMGFINYIIEKLGNKAFRDKKYKIMTEFIVCVKNNDPQRFNQLKAEPKKHPIIFNVPK
jgi:hypothetical protein